MGAPHQHNKGYKRSWRNLLLDKRYQLQFTLIMVGVSALMMIGLGWWVMKEADQATEVAKNNVPVPAGCDDPGDAAASKPDNGGARAAATGASAAKAGAPAGGAGSAAAGEIAEPEPDPADGEAATRRRRTVVTLDESTMEVAPTAAEIAPVPSPAVDQSAIREQCVAVGAQVRAIEDGRQRILYVLIGMGVLLCIGLGIYGIKMTHKVAGPLYKVSLYLGKMREGRFDAVYNLRKGDQLVSFYDHFKLAHGGVRAMQTADIERLEAVIAAAEAEKLGERSPELAVALDELRALLARKEASLD